MGEREAGDRAVLGLYGLLGTEYGLQSAVQRIGQRRASARASARATASATARAKNSTPWLERRVARTLSFGGLLRQRHVLLPARAEATGTCRSCSLQLLRLIGAG